MNSLINVKIRRHMTLFALLNVYINRTGDFMNV